MKTNEIQPINDPRDITLRQFLNNLSRIRIRALLSLMGFF
jgi:hypothetical protein